MIEKPQTAEPVAWMYDFPAGDHYIREHRDIAHRQLIAEGWTETPLYPAPQSAAAQLLAFQKGVDGWMDVCFNEAIKADIQERCDRFIEEALEFVQAVGYSAERAHALVDYTFGRPVGEINQEVGGVMVTLAAMCNTLGIVIGAAAEAELARVWTKVDAIRAKQAAKPTGSALPIAVEQPDPAAQERARIVAWLRKCSETPCPEPSSIQEHEVFLARRAVLADAADVIERNADGSPSPEGESE